MTRHAPAPSTGPSAEANLPSTSLIICSRNRPRLLDRAVGSILDGAEVPAELVIVDQSDAEHPSLAHLTTGRPCVIRYLHTASVGLSRANNAGIAAARHDVLAFSHDDIRVAPMWYGSLVRALVRAGPRSVVTGRVLADDAETPRGFAPSLKVDSAPATYAGRIEADVLYPMNMAMYRSVVDAVGRFDERLGPGTPFPAAEDNDFGFRLLEAGYRIVYTPEPVVYHRPWRTARISLEWGYGRGQGAYYAKHLSLRDRWMLRRMGRDVARSARATAGSVVRRRPPEAGSQAAYVLGMLSGVCQWLLMERGWR